MVPLKWTGRALLVLDQLLLPRREKWMACRNVSAVAKVIRDMNVRGAPAIGVAAAYGMALAARCGANLPARAFRKKLAAAGKLLKAARPTAVNLAWAVDRVLATVRSAPATSGKTLAGLAAREARTIEREDLAANLAMGKLGAGLLPKNGRILTHCNTGALATAGWGTALGIIRTAYRQGRIKSVWVDETRPYLQGARLTAWELKRERIPFTLITDNMAGHMMQRKRVDAVIVGADRITASGDVANKIGTYSLAVLARAHAIPFFVAAPVSTIDLATRHGSSIPIEERSAAEVTSLAGVQIAPPGTKAAHPAFDVTPGRLVTAIITERGVARPPYGPSLKRLVRRGRGTIGVR